MTPSLSGRPSFKAVAVQPAATLETIELPLPPPGKRKREEDDDALLQDGRMIRGLKREKVLCRTSNIPAADADLIEEAEPAELEWVEKDGSTSPEEINHNW